MSIIEGQLRQAAMAYLNTRPTPHVDYHWLREFMFNGEQIPLMDMQRGIRKPAKLSGALSIRTTYTKPGAAPPYMDNTGSDGFQRYKYRGTDPSHPENKALRRAFEDALPIIWFVGVAPGRYEPIYPVYVVGDDPSQLEFTLALDETQRLLMAPGFVMDEAQRAYAMRETKQRLHQRVFRSQVLLAYTTKCAICRLKHPELLDAAHILPDSHPNGLPIVPNGLTLCKIHHAAFDNKIIGVRPDYSLHVRPDVLEEVDGWMLKGGIQGVHNTSLAVIPTVRKARPSVDRLEERYAEFLAY
ncbi:HNH endonuclease [Ornithinimicrobium sp. INDO-MA30-4]|uniref:HNH endonuclease n=1 Tax=Ornithinimicrobium sp. INDO-MA30-4 TaxID=2908651 RepID=UPI001F1D889B|nr:HNH endonuclease signature motif containing protein [Ornithinimicrobium sp. INDO-MA30-4]UJH70012.1 HNH endonuclease [Ornithinimicrobium sp. INDO-MA30-4]